MISVRFGEEVVIAPTAIQSEHGYAYCACTGDRAQGLLFEDGNPLPRANAVHESIRNEGGGRYSFWGTTVYFSASDNSDPRNNGRTYTYWALPAPAAARDGAAVRAIRKAWLADAIRRWLPEALWRPFGLRASIEKSFWDHFETPVEHAARHAAARSLSPEQRFDLLVELGRQVLPQYRFNWPCMDWWRDAEFNRYLARFGELDGMNTERRWALHQLARLVASVPGDTAECGVYRGASSYLICAANRRAACARQHHLFDSFAGLSRPSALDGDHWHQGDLACPLATAQQNLAEFPGVQFHPGWIPERFGAVADRQFALVHIDVDLYEPTRDSIAFFYPRLNPGGILVCDDYGCTTCPGATRACDEFLAGRPEQMLALSAGGGYFIKGVATAPSGLA